MNATTKGTKTFEGHAIRWEGDGIYIELLVIGFWTWIKVPSLDWLEFKMAHKNVTPRYLVFEDLES